MTGAPIVLAAGGTGGHLFPAEALARELLARGRAVVLVTDRRAAAFKVEGVPVEHVRAATVLPGLAGKARTAIELGVGALQALRILRRLRPAAVVGFGGYPSLPTAWAAGRVGIPLVLHEQNAVLGRANHLLARGVDLLALAFPATKRIPAGVRAEITGNPVRPALAALAGQGYTAPGEGGVIRLLVVGGSHGARIFADVVPPAIAAQPEALRARLLIAQQCRAEDLDRVRGAYAAAGVPAECAPFFPDIAVRLSAAHAVIARAGASTIAELACAGRPSILVPLPSAIDDHQTANARALVEAGAARLMKQRDFEAAALTAQLRGWFENPGALAAAAAQAAALAHPESARLLADQVLAGIAAREGER